MNIFKKLFQQRSAKLYNGTQVKDGDKISFVDSDRQTHVGEIARRKDGTLYFWNITKDIKEYTNAYKL